MLMLTRSFFQIGMVQFRAIAAALALALLFLYLLPEPLQHLYTLSPRPVLSAGALAAGSAGSPLQDQPFVPDTLHSPPCQRPVYLYADLDLITELPFLTSVVLAGVRDACGACVRLRQRIEFPIHVRAGLLDCSAFVLAATFEMSGDELEALRSRPALARERMLYMHLSDEHEDRSVEGYELPRLILRNYYSASPDRLVNISYLMDSASSGGGGAAAAAGGGGGGSARAVGAPGLCRGLHAPPVPCPEPALPGQAPGLVLGGLQGRQVGQGLLSQGPGGQPAQGGAHGSWPPARVPQVHGRRHDEAHQVQLLAV